MEKEREEHDMREKERQKKREKEREKEHHKELEEQKIEWPKTDEGWKIFDLTKLKSGTVMPFKIEQPPDMYIVNGLVQWNLIPKEERKRYRMPCQPEEIEVPRNADGSIIIVDEKQKHIDRLTQQLEALPEGKQLLHAKEQQNTIDALISHLTALTNKVNDLTSASMAVPDPSSN